MSLFTLTAAPTSDADWLDALAERYKWIGVSVDAELVKMNAWLDANPRRRPRNLRRFTVNWLNRASQSQDARLLATRLRQSNPYAYAAALGRS